MKNKPFQAIAAVLFLVLLSSCDQQVVYRFVITNNTPGAVQFAYITSHKSDSITVQPGQSNVLLHVTEITGGREDFYKKNIYVFYKAVLLSQGVKALPDVTDRKYWQLKWISRDTGVYKLIVTPAFFEAF